MCVCVLSAYVLACERERGRETQTERGEKTLKRSVAYVVRAGAHFPMVQFRFKMFKVRLSENTSGRGLVAMPL